MGMPMDLGAISIDYAIELALDSMTFLMLVSLVLASRVNSKTEIGPSIERSPATLKVIFNSNTIS